MRFGVLGNLEVFEDSGRPITVRAGKQRLLLALLLCHGGDSVDTERLLEVLWPGTRPTRADLQVIVHRLRRLVGEGRIEHAPAGYSLRLEADELDVTRFEQYAASGERSLANGDPVTAAAELEQALSLWRGTAYGGLDQAELLRQEADRLEELRLATVEHSFEAGLALGRQATLVPEIIAFTTRNPLRERARGQLMRALHAAGRTAEALEVYRDTRQLLIEELGIEPCAELRRLEQAILADDPELTPPAQPSVTLVPAELPPPAAAFTGRQGEVDHLLERLAGGGPVLVAINGPGGTGKSALAIHVASQSTSAFPAGQLYVNLHGATPGRMPLRPVEVLGRFLRALGVEESRHAGHGEEEIANLFRSVTAGRRLLVVLDDAVNAAQVRPLLPAGPDSAVLITSRTVPATLDGAEHLQLDVLPADEAVELLGRLIGATRVAAEPAASAELAGICGGLPLAVRIAGARLAARPDWKLSSFADRLSDSRGRLDELEYGDLAVRTSCSVSHQALPPDTAQLFELLGLLDLTDLSAPVAAALADRPLRQVRRDLDRLVDARLVEADEDRYSMHDLLRLYAREQAVERLTPTDREGSVRRVLHWYLASSRTAISRQIIEPTRRLAVGKPSSELLSEGADLSGPDSVVDWIRTESANLIAIARQAATTAGDGSAVLAGLAAAVSRPLSIQGLWTETIAINAVALRVAVSEGQTYRQARAHFDLGDSYSNLEQYAECKEHLEAALACFGAADDPDGEALTLNSLGVTHQHQRKLDESLRYYERAHVLYRAVADVHGQATVLNNLGSVYTSDHRYDDAIDAFERSLALSADANSGGNGVALVNIGEAHHAAGRADVAVGYLERGIVLLRAAGHSYFEAVATWNLGDALQATGQPAEATIRWRHSLDLLCELGVITAAETAELITADRPERPEALRDR